MSTRPLAEEIAEVLRLDRLAEPGPWIDRGGSYQPATDHLVHDFSFITATGSENERYTDADRQRHNDNADLIAEYRSAAPRLARALERLTGDGMRERLCEQINKHVPPKRDWSWTPTIAAAVLALIQQVAEEESHG